MKQLLKTIKTDALEYWTLALLVVGLPLVAFLYVDLKLAFTVFVFINATIGLVYLRKAK